MLLKLAAYFFRGLIFLVPIALTFWVFVKAFLKIDGWLRLGVPGVGFLILLVVTTAFGFLLTNYLARRVLGAFERALDRLPFVKLLHTSVKDLMGAFVGEKKRFDRPVLVDLLPGGSGKAIGFITRESLTGLQLPDHVAVYLPQAYNFAGQLVIVRRDQVTPLEMTSADAMGFVVSGGISGA
jgi:uncharacterized membrane protein